MKIDRQSNIYTVIYASVLVIISALALSITYLKLKPLQLRNKRIQKELSILEAIKVYTSRDSATAKYKQYIVKTYVTDVAGNYHEDTSAFEIQLKEELKKPLKQRRLPVFVAKKDSQYYFIFPMYGKGLWGPIWGYIALKSDLNTIYGIMFDHKDETPGLGAEITKPWFREQFEGRKIFDEEGNFVSVAVVKGGAEPNNPHQVDAITGATLTSKGVDRMLRTCLQDYVNFIKKYQSQNSHAHE